MKRHREKPLDETTFCLRLMRLKSRLIALEITADGLGEKTLRRKLRKAEDHLQSRLDQLEPYRRIKERKS